MKHYGSNMEYGEERARDLMKAYDKYLSECEVVRMPEVYKAVAESPAPRFYVSDLRARVVVSKMLRGERLDGMRGLKREMFEEITRRVKALRREKPDANLLALCGEVVEQPAPKFYITPGSAKIFVCKARRAWAAEKLKRLKRYVRP